MKNFEIVAGKLLNGKTYLNFEIKILMETLNETPTWKNSQLVWDSNIHLFARKYWVLKFFNYNSKESFWQCDSTNNILTSLLTLNK